MVDQVESRLQVSRRCGADRVVDTGDGAAMEELNVEGAVVVIEATGAPDPIKRAIDLSRYGGRVVLLASTRGETTVNFYEGVHLNGLVLLGAHSGVRPEVESRPGTWSWRDDGTAFLRLLAAGRLEVSPLVTHQLPGERAVEAYARRKAWDNEPIGVLLQWKQ